MKIGKPTNFVKAPSPNSNKQKYKKSWKHIHLLSCFPLQKKFIKHIEVGN